MNPASGQRIFDQIGHRWPYAPDGNGGPPLHAELEWGAHSGDPGRLGSAAPLFPRLEVETVDSGAA